MIIAAGRKAILAGLFAIVAGGAAPAVQAAATAVDLELILATDTSGSVDATDFALRRSGIVTAFQSAAVISAIESGAIGSIAVSLWDFASNVGVAVDWTVISDAASASSFAALVAGAGRTDNGISDNQSGMLTQALTSLNNNNYVGTRQVVDITSEGAQDVGGCSFSSSVCTAVQNARDAFLAGGGSAINAIWMDDRDFFGLDAADLVNAFEYGTNNVIGGTGAFQVFAATNADFVGAIQNKLVREITNPIPEPEIYAMMGVGLGLLGWIGRRRKLQAA